MGIVSSVTAQNTFYMLNNVNLLAIAINVITCKYVVRSYGCLLYNNFIITTTTFSQDDHHLIVFICMPSNAFTM